MNQDDIIYILDFDRTLFNTDAFKARQVAQFGAAALGTLGSLEDINAHEFLFPDALDFLHSHKKENMYVVSSCAGMTGGWDTAYQRKKIKQSGVTEFVHEIHLVFNRKVAAIKKVFTGAQTVFVDDMSRHLEDVREVLPAVQTVHIARTSVLQSAYNTEADGIKTIQDLTGLDAIIEKGSKAPASA